MDIKNISIEYQYLIDGFGVRRFELGYSKPLGGGVGKSLPRAKRRVDESQGRALAQEIRRLVIVMAAGVSAV
jgi:hypothetical protein